MLSFPHSLARNDLAETGFIKKSKVRGSSFEVGAKVTYEGREMTVSMAPDIFGEIKMVDLSGIMALAASLPECGLTSLKCAAANSSVRLRHSVDATEMDTILTARSFLGPLQYLLYCTYYSLVTFFTY